MIWRRRITFTFTHIRSRIELDSNLHKISEGRTELTNIILRLSWFRETKSKKEKKQKKQKRARSRKKNLIHNYFGFFAKRTSRKKRVSWNICEFVRDVKPGKRGRTHFRGRGRRDVLKSHGDAGEKFFLDENMSQRPFFPVFASDARKCKRELFFPRLQFPTMPATHMG